MAANETHRPRMKKVTQLHWPDAVSGVSNLNKQDTINIVHRCRRRHRAKATTSCEHSEHVGRNVLLARGASERRIATEYGQVLAAHCWSRRKYKCKSKCKCKCKFSDKIIPIDGGAVGWPIGLLIHSIDWQLAAAIALI